MTGDRTGSKVRIILIGDRYYSGKIISENERTLTIIDKFGNEVTIGKEALISLEVISNA